MTVAPAPAPVPTVEGFFDAATHTVTYLVADPATGAAAVIDPVLDFDPAKGRTTTAPWNRSWSGSPSAV